MSDTTPSNTLTMNQSLQLRSLRLNLDRASREQLIELCMNYAEQLFLQQNAAKEMYHSLAIENVFGDSQQ